MCVCVCVCVAYRAGSHTHTQATVLEQLAQVREQHRTQRPQLRVHVTELRCCCQRLYRQLHLSHILRDAELRSLTQRPHESHVANEHRQHARCDSVADSCIDPAGR